LLKISAGLLRLLSTRFPFHLNFRLPKMNSDMNINRRSFIAGATAIAGSAGMSVRWANAAAPSKSPLVIVFLRGGIDILNLMAPVSDKAYEAARPIALRAGTKGETKGLELPGMVGNTEGFLLHHSAAPLQRLFAGKHMSIIPAAGLKNATRSHFQAMDLIERGIAQPAASGPRDGWLTRAALSMGQHEPGSILCMGGAMPQSLSLCEDALPVSDVWDIDWLPSQNFRQALFEIHTGDSPLDRASRNVVEATGALALRLTRDANKQPVLNQPPKGVSYPDHDFGRKMHFLAELLSQDQRIGVATADLDGWDMHENQTDRFAPLAATMSGALEAFQQHMEARGRDFTLVVQSEFGRRLKANESRGTDHGHGGLMLAMGQGVGGGQMLGSWPGLRSEQLDEGMDLAVTTDFRDVLASVLTARGQSQAVKAAFPGYAAKDIAI
jgi:uncharacterized protein (DUF1501 family)